MFQAVPTSASWDKASAETTAVQLLCTPLAPAVTVLSTNTGNTYRKAVSLGHPPSCLLGQDFDLFV
jgi:hypothetical protein